MPSRIEDFVTLFNALWYRDFPLAENHKVTGSRAEWTTHIGICVRSCADIMGFFTHFESGIRTDAIIKDNVGNDIVHIEWEWIQPVRESVNEIQKLLGESDGAEFSVFFSYSRLDCHNKNLQSIQKQWGSCSNSLLVFLVTFSMERKTRVFLELETYTVKNGSIKKIRSQPALPWKAKGTRWESKS